LTGSVQTSEVLDRLLPAQSETPEETVEFGRRLAAGLKAGDVVALYGDLGAGKTHLVKGIASAFGLDATDAASPTFVLLHEYPTQPPVYHFDAYRIVRPEEFTALGFEEYASGDGICVIEWPERIELLLPPGTIRLRLTAGAGDARRFERIEQ
jgi:tRNA threonylcarbamoyladenosine biosynthesis protein TsaE